MIFFSATDKRFNLGLLITLVWLCIMFYFLLSEFSVAKMMRPNEWGDFFAGFFSPIAFLWLVLGYLQQGQELQQSSRALLLQAEELKNSVDQQRELVEVTRQQVESDRDALSIKRKSMEDAIKPNFFIDRDCEIFANERCIYKFSIKNIGNFASNVNIYINVEGEESELLYESVLFENSLVVNLKIIRLEKLPNNGVTLLIKYSYADGRNGEDLYQVVASDDTGSSFLRFHKM